MDTLPILIVADNVVYVFNCIWILCIKRLLGWLVIVFSIVCDMIWP